MIIVPLHENRNSISLGAKESMIFNYIFSSTVYLLNKVETDKLRCKNIAYLALIVRDGYDILITK
jgi:hypothetical protein